MAATLLFAGPAGATSYGSETGKFCGARGTFKTINTVPQVRQASGYNGDAYLVSCFGVTPSGTVYWTSNRHPKWERVPGAVPGGAVRTTRANRADEVCPRNYACFADTAQNIFVADGAGHEYGTSYNRGWRGSWVKIH